MIALIELQMRGPSVGFSTFETRHGSLRNAHGVRVPTKLVTQLTHCQPHLGVRRQPLRRRQCFQHARRLRLVTRTHQHTPKLAPRVLVTAGKQTLQLTLRLHAITAIERQFRTRLCHRCRRCTQRLPAVQRLLRRGVIVDRKRKLGSPRGHPGVATQRHGLAIETRCGG